MKNLKECGQDKGTRERDDPKQGSIYKKYIELSQRDDERQIFD
jgi:hypothetical protein